MMFKKTIIIAFCRTSTALIAEVLLQLTPSIIYTIYGTSKIHGTASIALQASIVIVHPFHIVDTGMNAETAKNIQQHEQKGVHQHLSSCCRILHNNKINRFLVVICPKVRLFPSRSKLLCNFF